MSSSEFRLSQRSSRRRRLLLLGTASHGCTSAATITDDGQSSSTTLPRQQPAPQFSVTPPPKTSSMLEANRSLTWVFAGDALMAGTSEDSSFSPLVESMIAGVQAQRPQDRFVEALAPGLSIPNLVSAWETRVAVHRPQVLVLLCGHSDAVGRMRGLRAFEDALVNLLLICQRSAILPIINTPPCYPDSGRECFADRQIYLEALRSEARSHNAVLVDHWAHWEWTESEMGYTSRWYDETGLFPGPLGHQQMQRSFLQALQLHQHPELTAN